MDAPSVCSTLPASSILVSMIGALSAAASIVAVSLWLNSYFVCWGNVSGLAVSFEGGVLVVRKSRRCSRSGAAIGGRFGGFGLGWSEVRL